jgi:putative intracellular protease/amidase
MPNDWSIMNEEIVGDARQPLKRLALINADGLIATITAGGNNGKAELTHEQMMQRRVRQHHAVTGIARSDRGAKAYRKHPLLQ